MAVKRLALSITNGECLGMLGPNGSGKSTTINMMCGYFAPTRGTALVNQLDVRKDTVAIAFALGRNRKDAPV